MCEEMYRPKGIFSPNYTALRSVVGLVTRSKWIRFTILDIERLGVLWIIDNDGFDFDQSLWKLRS